LIEARDARDSTVRSAFEARMLRILRQLGDVVPDHRVVCDRQTFFLDFAFPAHRLGIECQSIKWHLGHERFQRDLTRDRLLTLSGWTVLYFTYDDVVFRRDQVARQVQAALSLHRSRTHVARLMKKRR